MKIKITTDRKPWLNNEPQAMGAEIDVCDATAAALVKLGFAEIIEAPKPVRRRKDDE